MATIEKRVRNGRLFEGIDVDSSGVIELLQGGHRASAVTLLEAELQEDPSDAEVRNAYGFACPTVRRRDC
jgi:hypothetical protein